LPVLKAKTDFHCSLLLCLFKYSISLKFFVNGRPEEDDPSAAAAKRNQTTAVILCGVIGALFDLELEKVGTLKASV
jgi:hypothetical protein